MAEKPTQIFQRCA